ncbi:hypothetical protein LTR53_010803, partial [Teratosphaeriaceae sp. CCFEE 6253]
MLLLRLPPAIRAATFARLVAPQQVRLVSGAAGVRPSRRPSLPRCSVGALSHSPRCHYATIDAGHQTDLQKAYNFRKPPIVNTAQSNLPAEDQVPPETGSADKDSLASSSSRLRRSLWRRAERRKFSPAEKVWLRAEVDAARRKDAADAVASLEALAKHERFNTAGATRKLPAVHAPPATSELSRVMETLTLPSPEEFGQSGVPSEPMAYSNFAVDLSRLCASGKRELVAEETFRIASSETEGRKHVCSLKVDIPDVHQETLSAEASTKFVAKQAVWLKLLASMHACGSLKDLTSRGKTYASPLQDINHVTQSATLPTKADYPQAPNALFNSAFVQDTIAGACGPRKLAMQADVEFTSHRPSQGVTSHSCALKLELEGLFSDATLGEGMSKQSARHAAWLLMLAKMHGSGSLAELFPNLDNPQDPIGQDGEVLAPAMLSNQVMQEEKEAMTEIYNYAAGYGCLPEVTAMRVQPRTARARRGRQAPTPKALTRATISLPQLGINVSGVGRDLRTAETAAALAFKVAAEERRSSPDTVSQQTPVAPQSLLSTDTAKDFFTYLRETWRGVQIDVEHEPVHIASTSRQSAR